MTVKIGITTIDVWDDRVPQLFRIDQGEGRMISFTLDDARMIRDVLKNLIEQVEKKKGVSVQK